MDVPYIVFHLISLFSGVRRVAADQREKILQGQDKVRKIYVESRFTF